MNHPLEHFETKIQQPLQQPNKIVEDKKRESLTSLLEEVQMHEIKKEAKV